MAENDELVGRPVVDGPPGLALLVDCCLEGEFWGARGGQGGMEGVHDLWSAAVVEGPQAAEDLASAGGEEGGLQTVDLIAVQFLGLGVGVGIR